MASFESANAGILIPGAQHIKQARHIFNTIIFMFLIFLKRPREKMLGTVWCDLFTVFTTIHWQNE